MRVDKRRHRPFGGRIGCLECIPLSEQARVDHRGTASILLAKLRSSGHFGRLKPVQRCSYLAAKFPRGSNGTLWRANHY